jgi:hypothetical protein
MRGRLMISSAPWRASQWPKPRMILASFRTVNTELTHATTEPEPLITARFQSTLFGKRKSG